MTRLAMWVLLPIAANAQPYLVTLDGTNQTRVGDAYDYGKVAAGDLKDVTFGACNTASVSPAVRGVGFSISAVYGYVPGQCLKFTVRFSATQPGSYSASLQVSTINVFLLATVLPTPSLTVFPACTVDASSGAINFGNVANGTLRLCNFSLQNANSQSLVVSTLAVTGAFQGPKNLPTPFTLTAGQTVTFTIQVTPTCGTNALSGVLTVNTRNYPLTLTSFIPALPKPALTFDSSTIASGEQHKLTMSLPTASPCGADGYVNLAFAPSASVVDDPTIVFVAGNTRAAPFHFNAGSTEASFVFATGSTAGTITFSVAGVQAALVIPATPVSIDTATASNQRLGNLDINVVGFDNTYTAGAMSFTFLDASGKAIGPINADFTSAFKTYFTSQKSGSAFLMRVSFQVTGDQKQIANVKLTLTNSAGQTQTGSLTFQ